MSCSGNASRKRSADWPIHCPSLTTHSIRPILLVPLQTELRSLITYGVYRDPKRDITDPKEFATSGYDRESMKECWRLLDLTSRSFSRVIKELDGELARVVSLA